MMGFAGHYLQRFSDPDPRISISPSSSLKYIVVIPAYSESGLMTSLDSLFNCYPVDEGIEIICVINWPEGSDKETVELNNEIYRECLSRVRDENRNYREHFLLLQDMPSRHAGVGYARKYGMDEAVRRFDAAGTNGIIVSFDADAVCDPNLFVALNDHFQKYPSTDGCCIYFEHPLSGNEFSLEIYDAILYYELHLRYYYQGLKFTGHSNTFHTVGSSFAVKAEVYCQQGGMNKRKAGEDFYFLQKFFDLGNFSECVDTRIIPSARPSSRVPFGTGRAVNEYLRDPGELKSFNPTLFRILKSFFSSVPLLFDSTDPLNKINLDESLLSFLKLNDFDSAMDEIKRNSVGYENFRKRFFRWFNMFRMLKFLNYAATYYPEVTVSQAASELLPEISSIKTEYDVSGLLQVYRDLERFRNINLIR